MTLKEDLRTLAVEWSNQCDFLDNPEDSPIDRAAGKAYSECADMLLEVMSKYRMELNAARGQR
jgi:hypothetical protein